MDPPRILLAFVTRSAAPTDFSPKRKILDRTSKYTLFFLIYSPVNLLDSFEDRFSYAFAFGATASRIIVVILGSGYASIFGNDFQSVANSNSIPSWSSGERS